MHGYQAATKHCRQFVRQAFTFGEAEETHHLDVVGTLGIVQAPEQRFQGKQTGCFQAKPRSNPAALV